VDLGWSVTDARWIDEPQLVVKGSNFERIERIGVARGANCVPAVLFAGPLPSLPPVPKKPPGTGLSGDTFPS
jgi:hypothetical protein